MEKYLQVKVSKNNDTDTHWEIPAYLLKMLEKDYGTKLHIPLTYNEKWNSHNLINRQIGSYPNNIDKWLEKAIAEQKNGCLSIFVVRVSTSAIYFHELIAKHADVEFIKGKLIMRPYPTDLNAYKKPSPCPSMICTFRPKNVIKCLARSPRLTTSSYPSEPPIPNKCKITYYLKTEK